MPAPEYPPLPRTPGWYILRDGTWKPTDQLTYRTFAQTAQVPSQYGIS